MRFLILALCAMALPALAEEHAAAGHGSEIHWGYEGAGAPENWGKLKPEYEQCKLGKQQSPINIVEKTVHKGGAAKLTFQYQPSVLRVWNNGHSVQANIDTGSQIQIGDEAYQLVQLHFHAPSEEQINGRNHDMVVHLVHKNAVGNLAVVAVMLDKGGDNPALKAILGKTAKTASSEMVYPSAKLDPNQFLPKQKSYWNFMGSLTTPPCSENVKWFVMKTPILISENDYNAFTALYPYNARPVQPVWDRPIREN